MKHLRVLTLAALLASTVAVLAAHSARAQASTWLSELGDGVAALARARGLDTPRTLRVNGIALHLAVGTSQTPIADVLTGFATGCGLKVESSSETHGELACLDAAQAVRFVRAERDGTGGTFAVSVWSDAALPLAAAFPVHADAPGADLIGVPRPEHAQRILSARQEGRDAALNVYRSSAASSAALLHDYRATLQRAQFQLLEAPRAAGQDATASTFIARREQTAVLVTITADARGRGMLLLASL